MVGLHALRTAAHAVPLHEQQALQQPGEVPGFAIHAVHSERHRLEASRLVHHRYVQRGYRRAHPTGEREANLLTLSAIGPEGTLGTLGVRFEGSQGLNADAVFEAEMATLRGQGRELCEFTQLAIDMQTASKPVLAGLFHAAYLAAYKVHGADLLVIEVNPRHVPYYRRMLDFKVCSESRTNTRVHAPAVLMSLDLSHAEQQINRYGGHPAMASVVRSLYPHFFSRARELALLAQLKEEHQLAA